MEGLLVPSSIQRIRSFLVEMCGMKVKPWASTEETLAALHATLVARGGCDIFWTSLRGLLETLARDLKARREASPGQLVDNEILDGERYTALLDEIRAVLARQATEAPASTFRRLAQTLSAPALGLLLLLGGVASIGCGREPLHGPSLARDAAALPDASDARPDVQPDRRVQIQLPDATPAAPDTRPAAPDTRPVGDAATTGPDGATVTIKDIMDSCGIPSEQQAFVLGCLAGMRASWSTGMAALLAGQDCVSVARALDCSGAMQCASWRRDTEFDPNYPAICTPVLIYVGVRFV